MGIDLLQFIQKMVLNHVKKYFDDLIKLHIILNENLRLFFTWVMQNLCKNCAKIYEVVFQRVETC